ncbi:MAG: ABC transporter ATP-binding protein [Candidatus Omnitrophica bacterium]|nr:ABC transporter ATP-binding protein [Candidatus Omnitrophota bacterium]
MFPSGISVSSASFVRSGRAVLHEVTFDAPENGVTVLFGPSGAGKTTCLRLIAGLEHLSDGQILFGGEVLSSKDVYLSPRRRRVGYCFQEEALWPALNVREHLTATLRAQYRDRAWIDLQAQELLDRFGLTSLARRMPAHLSGGEKKRLALSRALAANPSILLLDEPLSSLDGPARDELIAYLKTCRHEKRSVILVTHQLDETFALGDRLVILVGGRVLQQGDLREVMRRPQSRQAAQLLGYRNFYQAVVDGRCLKTPFGEWETTAEWQGEVTAAAYAQDITAEADPRGEGIVESCRPALRYFRLQVRYRRDWVEAMSLQDIPAGQRVSLRDIHPPAIFKEDP